MIIMIIIIKKKKKASISQYNLNDNFYDLDGLQIHSLYSSLDNFSSPMFMNSR